jgi:hypothetical protein
MYISINESIGIVFDNYISTRSRIYNNTCMYADNKNNTKQTDICNSKQLTTFIIIANQHHSHLKLKTQNKRKKCHKSQNTNYPCILVFPIPPPSQQLNNTPPTLQNYHTHSHFQDTSNPSHTQFSAKSPPQSRAYNSTASPSPFPKSNKTSPSRLQTHPFAQSQTGRAIFCIRWSNWLGLRWPCCRSRLRF